MGHVLQSNVHEELLLAPDRVFLLINEPPKLKAICGADLSESGKHIEVKLTTDKCVEFLSSISECPTLIDSFTMVTGQSMCRIYAADNRIKLLGINGHRTGPDAFKDASASPPRRDVLDVLFEIGLPFSEHLTRHVFRHLFKLHLLDVHKSSWSARESDSCVVMSGPDLGHVNALLGLGDHPLDLCLGLPELRIKILLLSDHEVANACIKSPEARRGLLHVFANGPDPRILCGSCFKSLLELCKLQGYR